MTTKYEIQICSDVDYDMLIAEIYIDGEFIALLSQEDGPSNLKIELPIFSQNEDKSLKTFDLALFEEAIETAKARLLE